MSLIQNFTTRTEDSGRFMVTSKRTRREYFVEAIGEPTSSLGFSRPSQWKNDDQKKVLLNMMKHL